MRGIYLLKEWEIRTRFKDTILRTRYKIWCSAGYRTIFCPVSGVWYCSYSQYLDYCVFSGLSAIKRVQHASCSRSNMGVYCKLLYAAMMYVPLLLLLLLCFCWCCGRVCTAAAAAPCCCSCYFWCCAPAAVALMCGKGHLFCTSDVGSRYSSP